MDNIKVLDCTLRDGGYINDWNFGKENIKKIIDKLSKANIDIIECGFISNKKTYDDNHTKFNTIEEFNSFIPSDYKGLAVCMMNFGEYNVSDLSLKADNKIGGIRIAFHKKDRFEALKLSKQIKDKGYKVFLQPMLSLSYSDEEFVQLIMLANEIDPFAFYIVDSFGSMDAEDLVRYYDLTKNNLNSNINIGFHSHNNLQLSYSNTLMLLKKYGNDKMIIDSSIYGMGRGAGNLNTELFLGQLNKIENYKYNTDYLFEIIDDVLYSIYRKNSWGYSLPYYFSAINCCHPNYASYLVEKNTLSISTIGKILKSIPEDKKMIFDKEYIEKKYIDYQETKVNDFEDIKKLREIIGNKKVLLLGPGKRILDESEKIKRFIHNESPFVISVNFVPEDYDVDMIFINSNKRFGENKVYNKPLLITSNINYKNLDNCYIIEYSNYLNGNSIVSDNALLMLLKLFDLNMSNEVFLAGFDGYNEGDYYNILNKEHEKNEAILEGLTEITKKQKIKLLTNSRYNKILETYHEI